MTACNTLWLFTNNFYFQAYQKNKNKKRFTSKAIIFIPANVSSSGYCRTLTGVILLGHAMLAEGDEGFLFQYNSTSSWLETTFLLEFILNLR